MLTLHDLSIKLCQYTPLALQFQMKLENFVPSFFQQDPKLKQLKKQNIVTDSLEQQVIAVALQMYHNNCAKGSQQEFLKMVIKHLEEKGSNSKKLKILSLLLQFSKISKYDVCDIIMHKKMKSFTKPFKLKKKEAENSIIQNFIGEELLIPIYNYIMKLSANEELYNTCKTQEVPFDEIFRRGTKIRFIWIFKLYNLINQLIPIFKSILKPIALSKKYKFFPELISYLYNDMVLMNNFIVTALEQASNDNFMLMPYFDMLQFYESLQEQIKIGAEISTISEDVEEVCQNFKIKYPKNLKISSEEIEEIEIQAMRVKLISNSLKIPKKDNTILQTQYNQKVDKKKQRTLVTEPNQIYRREEVTFKEKYRHLDR